MTVYAQGDAELNGLRLGNRDNPGSPYLIINMTALDMPEIVSNRYSVIGQHGVFFPGQDFYSGRSMEVEMLIKPPSGGATAVRQAIDDLYAASVTYGNQSPINLDAWLPGDAQPWRYVGRVSAIEFPEGANTIQFGHVECTLRFDTELPGAVSVDEETLTIVTGAQVLGGWEYPRTYNYTYGSSGLQGSIARNTGNFPAEPIFIVNGQCTDPTITNETTGQSIVLTRNLVIPSGSFLEIDVRNATVMLGGESSRYGNINLSQTEWIRLVPGNNVIRWSASSTSGSSLTVKWRSVRI